MNSKAQHSNDGEINTPMRGNSMSGIQAAQQQKTGQSTEGRSEMQDSGIPTPRDLNTRNVPGGGGSGTLPENKKSMDSMGNRQPPNASEMLQKVQSATQSQQFRTVEDSKQSLNQNDSATGEVGIKMKL